MESVEANESTGGVIIMWDNEVFLVSRVIRQPRYLVLMSKLPYGIWNVLYAIYMPKMWNLDG